MTEGQDIKNIVTKWLLIVVMAISAFAYAGAAGATSQERLTYPAQTEIVLVTKNSNCRNAAFTIVRASCNSSYQDKLDYRYIALTHTDFYRKICSEREKIYRDTKEILHIHSINRPRYSTEGSSASTIG